MPRQLGPIYDVSDPCYTSTHPNQLQSLVSNDDGYGRRRIDAVVQALVARPNVHVTVAAPATNQSGAGGKTTPGGVTARPRQTLSGYAATAVNGFPADSVLYALNTMHLNPDLLVSGINFGQNIGPFISVSGTVGAARVGGRASIPAVAVSQGFGSPPDYPSGVTALMDWFDQFLLGRAGPPLFQSVVNINVPTCTHRLDPRHRGSPCRDGIERASDRPLELPVDRHQPRGRRRRIHQRIRDRLEHRYLSQAPRPKSWSSRGSVPATPR